MDTRVRFQDGVVIVEPASRLIGASIVELRDTLYSEIGRHASPHILFDFHRTRRIDSGGLGVLLNALALVKNRGGSLGVMNLSNIKSLLMQGHLLRYFEHYDEEHTAVSCLLHAA